MSDKFDPALDEFVSDSTEYDWDADTWLGKGDDLDTDALNELQCALSGARSRELDRIISGQTTDKSRADRIQAAIDRLPVIEDGDRELVEEAVHRYRSKIRHQRLPYEHKMVEGVTRLKVVLVNDFHGTEVTVWPEVIRDETVMFSPGQVQRCRRELCGVEGCTCGGFLGERWRGSGYADLRGQEEDGSVRAWAASFFLDPSELEEY